MQTEYYLIHTCSGDYPQLKGPYQTETEQKEWLKNIIESEDYDPYEDVILSLTINNGKPFIGSYSDGYMDEIRKGRDDHDGAGLGFLSQIIK